METSASSEARSAPLCYSTVGVLRRRGALVAVREPDEAVVLTEQVAPEHLELLVRRRAAHAERRWAVSR